MINNEKVTRAWEIYKILIQQNAKFADNTRYLKPLAKTALNAVKVFDDELN